MTLPVHSYTVYHSPNAYLGTVLLRRALATSLGAAPVRRPIFVPRGRGVLVAEMLDGRENRNAGSYNREDCQRWADRHGIPFRYPPPGVFPKRAERWARSPFHREELPARAYYAARPDRRDALDEALFAAAWVEGLDVNEPETIRWAAARAGLDGEALLAAAAAGGPADGPRAALREFDALRCPGVPTAVVGGERFFGKDRVEWAVEACERGATRAAARLRASVEVRDATAADRDFLFGLAPRLAGVPRPDWHDAGAMAAFQDRFMAATLGKPAEGALTLVAASGGGQRLGYVHARPGRDGVTDEPCGHVAIIALAEEVEGLGAAGKLMARAEDWARARGHRLLSLDVFATNRRALDFYARGGFRPETIRLVKPL